MKKRQVNGDKIRFNKSSWKYKEVIWIPINELKVHNEGPGSYQRPENPARIRAIASKWDELAFCNIQVGKRKDDSLWVVEGQQRMGAARILGFKSVPCLVFDSEGSSHEAELFHLINNERTKPDAYTLFKGAVGRKIPSALKMFDDAEELGYEFLPQQGSGSARRYQIKCVATMGASYRRNSKLASRLFFCWDRLFTGEALIQRVWKYLWDFSCECEKQGIDWMEDDKLLRHLQNVGVIRLSEATHRLSARLKRVGEPTSQIGLLIMLQVFKPSKETNSFLRDLSMPRSPRGVSSLLPKLTPR